MSLAAGGRLGPYEIVAAIGAGGMGQVYKARDSRLDLTVAVKVLSQSLATDPSFHSRFERETKPSPRPHTRTSSPFMTWARKTASSLR